MPCDLAFHFCFKSFPCQRKWQKNMPNKETAAHNEVRWTVQFKQEQLIRFKCSESLFSTWTPKVQFVWLFSDKKIEPITISQIYINLHRIITPARPHPAQTPAAVRASSTPC